MNGSVWNDATDVTTNREARMASGHALFTFLKANFKSVDFTSC